jgi:hypothetical protein
MASTLKVTNIDTPDGTGNITVDRPLSGSGASLTSLPAGNLTGTLPAIDGSALTGISAGADTSLSNLSATGENRVVQVWVNFNGTGTVAIRDSYNVSSITDNGSGTYDINFASALGNVNYSLSSLGTHESGNSAPRNICFKEGNTRSTSAINITNEYYTGSLADAAHMDVTIFGD